MKLRKFKHAVFKIVCTATTLFTTIVLFVLIYHIFMVGKDWLSFDFLNNFPSRRPSKAGLKSALHGSIWIIVLTAAISVPIGIASATYFEEYALKKSKIIYWLQVNIANLAGMPSIIYGLLGLALFVRYLSFENSILSGSLTLSLLILPMIIITSQGAISSVPNSIREGAYAIGARKWQVILFHVIPAALPDILTGVILSVSRAMGETAPLIIVGALSFISFTPESIYDPFSVLPVQIYNWVSRPQEDFHSLAAAGIIVLLAVLLSMNIVAILLRRQRHRL